MPEILNTTCTLVNEKLKFTGSVESKPPVQIDYTPPLSDGDGYTSLELLLLSLSSCVGSAVATFLRRMNKKLVALNISAQGTRRETHPLSFSSIELTFNITSPDITVEDVDRTLKLSEEQYCPVWALIKGNVPISTKIVITKI